MFGLSDAAIRIAGAALVIMAILVGVYFKGRHDVQVNFDVYKAEVRAAADAQEEKARQIDAKNKRLFEETKNAYNNQLTNLRAYYGMRSNNTGSGLMPKVLGTAGGVDAYSPDNLPPTTVLAAQCAETTLTLIMLQNYERLKANNME